MNPNEYCLHYNVVTERWEIFRGSDFTGVDFLNYVLAVYECARLNAEQEKPTWEAERN